MRSEQKKIKDASIQHQETKDIKTAFIASNDIRYMEDTPQDRINHAKTTLNKMKPAERVIVLNDMLNNKELFPDVDQDASQYKVKKSTLNCYKSL